MDIVETKIPALIVVSTRHKYLVKFCVHIQTYLITIQFSILKMNNMFIMIFDYYSTQD